MPIITVSRMYGARGSDLAALVAERLGWSLLDNAFVDRVAASLGTTADDIRERDERVPSLAERLADALSLSAPELLAPTANADMPPSEARMVEVTTRVIVEAVAQGPVVVVGRGAQAALASRSDALHVLCYGRREALVAHIAAKLGLSPDAAAHEVDATNKRREQYVRTYWNRSWLAHENYHVCVNTPLIGLENAADIVVTLAKRMQLAD